MLDLGSRRLIGFSLEDNMRTGRVSSAQQAEATTRDGDLTRLRCDQLRRDLSDHLR